MSEQYLVSPMGKRRPIPMLWGYTRTTPNKHERVPGQSTHPSPDPPEREPDE